jgi:pimeloyl-ACP methyl ester carboxylesterase
LPYVNNSGVRIHFQVEGDGPPLVLQHGLTQCTVDWIECGYAANLRPHFRVIMIDARGHGQSDKPHDAALYDLSLRVSDVTSVLDALNVARADYWGYSMGGYIGFGLAKFCPDRLDHLVIGGQHPYARDQSVFRGWVKAAIAGGTPLKDAIAAIDPSLMESYKKRLRAADLNALLAATPDRETMEEILPNIAAPCFLYVGEEDPILTQVRSAASLIPSVRLLTIPGLTHLGAFNESHLILQEVTEFLLGKSGSI